MITGKQKSNTLKIAGVYTSIILGAGFASGQELMQFFVRYGTGGMLGLILSGAIFSVVGWFVLDISSQKKLYSYHKLAEYIAGKRFSIILEILAGLFMLVLFTTMLAAGGAVAVQAFGSHYTLGVVIIGVMSFISLLFDMEGVVKINVFIAPFMVIGGVFVGLYAFFSQISQTFSANALLGNWVSSAVVYASYNIITAISVLASMGSLADKKNTAKRSGILGGCCMALLGLSLSLPIFLNYTQVASVEIPILVIIEKYGAVTNSLYLFVLIAAIYTTALVNALAAIQWLNERFKINTLLLKILLPTAGILCAHIGFSNFVGVIYPIFGYFGLIEIVLVILGWLRLKRK